MNIKTRNKSGVMILDLTGNLLIGVGDVALRKMIDAAINEGVRNILVNLEGIDRMDSSGLGELVSSSRKVSNRGGKLKLMNLTSRVESVLEMSGLRPTFEVFDDEIDALASFR